MKLTDNSIAGASQSYGTGNNLDMTYSLSGKLCHKTQDFIAQDALFAYSESRCFGFAIRNKIL